MNETVDIVLGDSIGDALNAVDVNVLVGEVPNIVSGCPAYRSTAIELTW